jgi:hypothetical protein
MSSLIQQRRAMYEQKMQDDYPDVDFGVASSRIFYTFPSCALPMVEIPSNCTSITVYHKVPNGCNFAVFYNTSQSPTANYSSQGGNTRNFAITAGTYGYMRCAINLDYIDDCYIHDDTNNQYLWKGKNVV